MLACHVGAVLSRDIWLYIYIYMYIYSQHEHEHDPFNNCVKPLTPNVY